MWVYQDCMKATNSGGLVLKLFSQTILASSGLDLDNYHHLWSYVPLSTHPT